MVRLTGAVITHPDRAARAARLVAGAPPGLLDVVVDPEPGGPPTALRSTLRAWSAVPAAATHHLVLQDDVVLAPGFFEHAGRAAAAFPSAALAFFANWNSRNGAAVRVGALTGADWVGAASEYTPCAALLLPAEVAAGYGGFARGRPAGWSEDVIMNRYLRARGVPTYVAVPNPVEHARLPSLLGNDGHGVRLSACHGEPGRGSVLDEPAAVPIFKRGRTRCAVRVSRTGWEYIDGDRFLQRAGVDPRRRDFERAMEALNLPLGRDVLWQAWLAACCLGVTASALDDRPVADRALATLGPGGLCDSHPYESLQAMSAGLHELARRGVEAGLRGSGPRPRPRARRPPRIVVTRGSGVLAEYVARRLADHGHHVLSYGPEPLLRTHPGVEYATGGLRAALGGAEAVVHLAELDDAYGRRAGAPEPHATREVLDAAAAAGVPRLVYAGSGAEARTAGRSCADLRGEVSTHVLRLGVPYGPGVAAGTAIARLIDHALRGAPLEDVGDQVLQPIHLHDLAAAIHAVLTKCPDHPVFDIAGPPITLEALARAVSRDIGPISLPDLPSPASPAPVSPTPVMSTDLAAETLAWAPAESLNDTLSPYAQWLAYDA